MIPVEQVGEAGPPPPSRILDTPLWHWELNAGKYVRCLPDVMVLEFVVNEKQCNNSLMYTLWEHHLVLCNHRLLQ